MPIAGQQQHGELRLLHGRGGGLDQLEFVDLGEAVLDRRTGEAVAVGDFEHRHAGRIERAGDAHDLVDA